MKVKSMEYLNEERNECFLTLINKETEIVCFSDMEKHFLGEEINSTLQSFSVSNIMISEINEEIIKRRGSHNYIVIGHLINKEEGFVTSKSFSFHIESQIIPGDLRNGDAICFEVERFDLF